MIWKEANQTHNFILDIEKKHVYKVLMKEAKNCLADIAKRTAVHFCPL